MVLATVTVDAIESPSRSRQMALRCIAPAYAAFYQLLSRPFDKLPSTVLAYNRVMYNTERLVLRAFRESDVQDITDMWNDPTVQRGLAADHVHPRPPKFAEELRDWVNKDAFYAVIESKETGAFMGTTCIWLLGSKNRDGMAAIGLLPIYWNKGYGTEALGWVVDYGFRWLALHRVSLSVFESNKGAIGSYKKIGFTVEGVKRKANWADGKWEDVIDMGILDEDWAAKQTA